MGSLECYTIWLPTDNHGKIGRDGRNVCNMIFDNPIFRQWYTDTVDIYRVVNTTDRNITRQKRQKVNSEPIPCRVYLPGKGGPSMTANAAREKSSEEMACDLSVDIQAGDELMVVRGGALGHSNAPERYFAGTPVSYYDPVGGALTGLQHKEVGLLRDNIIKGAAGCQALGAR